jgi:hypothetical protein
MQIIQMVKIKEYGMKTFQVVIFGLLMGFLFFFISNIKSPYDFHTKVVTTLYDEIDNKESLIIVRGTNVKEDIESMAKFVSIDIFNWLPLLPSGPYSFVLDDKSWIFICDSELSDKHIEDLHNAFASKFPRGVIRKRDMPNGSSREDIVEDKQGSAKESKKVRGFDVLISTHLSTNDEFVTGKREKVFLFGNDISLSRRAIYAF